VAKKPAADLDALVDTALLRVATADTPPGLSAKGHADPLFADKKAPSGAVIDRLTADDDPLVRVDGKGKAEVVRLTAAGFRRVLPKLPEERVGSLAKSFAAGLGAADRVAFLDEVVRRTPTAAPELLPELEVAAATEKAEAEARIAAAAKRREREEASRAALAQWLALLDRRQQDRRDALRREYEAEGGRAEELPEPSAMQASREPVAPRTPEDHGFRREVMRRLAAAWREAVELGRDEPARFLEAGIGNVRGVRQVGEAGETVRFDGEVHEAGEGVSTGTPVRVVRPGWTIDEDEDRRFVVLKAKVAR
jgi:hypothetical protein